jgi:hypothetical protein
VAELRDATRSASAESKPRHLQLPHHDTAALMAGKTATVHSSHGSGPCSDGAGVVMTVALSASLSARRISDFAHPAADVRSAGVSLLPVRCRATSVASLADALQPQEAQTECERTASQENVA